MLPKKLETWPLTAGNMVQRLKRSSSCTTLELSVFGTNPFPGNDIPSVNWANVDALAYVKPIILTNNQTLVNGDGKPLFTSFDV
jgi:hypothetical protein